MIALTTDDTIRMISLASARLRASAAELSRLDAVAGDGDHGLNIAAAFADATDRISDRQPASPAEVFLLVATACSESGGGSAGALFGAFFETLGRRVGETEAPHLIDLVDGLDLATHRVAALGQSRAGDKTMLDALLPAVEAARASAIGDRAGSVLTVAAAAAERGADGTSAIAARAGRARYSASGALGTRDPGAVTVAVMLRAWADAMAVPLDGTQPVTAHRRAARTARLDRLATESGQFAILALDHVRSFAMTLRPDDPESFTADEMHGLKGRLIDGLATGASAVLIDPVLAERRFGASRRLGPGFIVGIEDGDYATAAESPRLRPGWSVQRAADLGADAIKISFTFRPADTSAAEAFVRDVARACELVDLPLFCEPIVQTGSGDDVRRGVLEGVRRFGDLGPDVLKIQFPSDTVLNGSRGAWADACGEADDLSPVPWALLSEGRGFDEFRELLAIACRAGASGFVAGRAIWGLGATERDTIPASAARLLDLRSVAVKEGSPWRNRRRDQTVTAAPPEDDRFGGSESEEVTDPVA